MPDILDALDAQRRSRAGQGPSPVDLAAHRHMQSLIVMRMEHLLEADEWQTFLAHLTALKARARDDLDQHRNTLESGVLVGEALARTALEIRCLRERIDTYEQVLALPEQLIWQGKKSLDIDTAGTVQKE